MMLQRVFQDGSVPIIAGNHTDSIFSIIQIKEIQSYRLDNLNHTDLITADCQGIRAFSVDLPHNNGEESLATASKNRSMKESVRCSGTRLDASMSLRNCSASLSVSFLP